MISDMALTEGFFIKNSHSIVWRVTKCENKQSRGIVYCSFGGKDRRIAGYYIEQIHIKAANLLLLEDSKTEEKRTRCFMGDIQ